MMPALARSLVGLMLFVVGIAAASVGPEPLLILSVALGLVCLAMPDDQWRLFR